MKQNSRPVGQDYESKSTNKQISNKQISYNTNNTVWDSIVKLLEMEEKKELETRPARNKTNSELITVYIKQYAYIYTENLSIYNEKKIKNYFTISTKNIMGFWDKSTAYMTGRRNGKKILIIPRFGAFILKKSRKFNINININIVNKLKLDNVLDCETDPYKYMGKFKGNQELVFNEVLDKYYSPDKISCGHGGLILNLEAGQGKSFVALALISHLQVPTLIIVHNTTILFQWIKIIEEFFPNIQPGIYYGKKKQEGSGHIIIGIINSLTQDSINFEKNTYTYQQFYKTRKFCIFDESHEYCSPTRRKIFNRCQAPYMLGLSATPREREDKLDKIVEWQLGPILNAREIPGYCESKVSFKGEVTMVKYYGPREYTQKLICEKLDMVSVPLMIEQLTQDPERKQIIVDLISEYRQAGLNIFVFADRRKYLEDIDNILKVQNNNNGRNNTRNNAHDSDHDNARDNAHDSDHDNARDSQPQNIEISTHFLTNENEYNALTSSIKSVSLLGGSCPETIDNAEKYMNVILCTYSFMGTGKSIPKMNAIILATPRKTKSRQFINRIFRLGSDHTITRQIADIVDWKTSLKNQWYARKKYYNEKNYEIKTRIIKSKHL
jgi:hypothetical protein